MSKNSNPYYLGNQAPQINAGGLRPPLNFDPYRSIANYGSPAGFDGAGGSGLRVLDDSLRLPPVTPTVSPSVSPSGGNLFGFDIPFFSNDKQQGWGGTTLGAAQGLFGAWLGMKQYGLAKKQLAEGKQQFALNYDAQRTTTNAQLEDRQRARVSSAPAGAYQSVGDYMAAHAIKPRG